MLWNTKIIINREQVKLTSREKVFIKDLYGIKYFEAKVTEINSIINELDKRYVNLVSHLHNVNDPKKVSREEVEYGGKTIRTLMKQMQIYLVKFDDAIKNLSNMKNTILKDTNESNTSLMSKLMSLISQSNLYRENVVNIIKNKKLKLAA